MYTHTKIETSVIFGIDVKHMSNKKNIYFEI